MVQRLLPVFIIALILWLGCAGDNSNATGKIINPNGDTELALLMRDMFDKGMITKQQIIDGKEIKAGFDYKSIHTAEATEPEKAASTEFKLYAKAYEASMDALLASDKASRAGAYQTMVTSCMNCHPSMCPGPTPKIKKMFLSDAEMAMLQTEK